MQFLYRLVPSRPEMLATGPTEEEAEVLRRHVDFLTRLTAEGVVLTAGRTLDVDRGVFGIVVFEAETDEAADAVMSADPAVEHGVMHAELFPFRVATWATDGPTVGSADS
jgi:uncharacterized protein YciI